MRGGRQALPAACLGRVQTPQKTTTKKKNTQRPHTQLVSAQIRLKAPPPAPIHAPSHPPHLPADRSWGVIMGADSGAGGRAAPNGEQSKKSDGIAFTIPGAGRATPKGARGAQGVGGRAMCGQWEGVGDQTAAPADAAAKVPAPSPPLAAPRRPRQEGMRTPRSNGATPSDCRVSGLAPKRSGAHQGGLHCPQWPQVGFLHAAAPPATLHPPPTPPISNFWASAPDPQATEISRSSNR